MITDTFLILPALDLRGGKVVRLAQGDPTRQTTYGDDPLVWAERWKSAGAAWSHVVNLDGAFSEDAVANIQVLQRLLTLGLKIEFGGGVRDRASIERLLDLGVERLCLGTAAIQDPAMVDWAIGQYGPARIVADIAVRDGQVMTKGWQESTPLTALDLGNRFRNQGIETCVLTDVRRDGVGVGIDPASAVALQQATGLQVVASGGVSRLDEIQAARQAHLAGIILGRALYEGKIILQDCFNLGN